jgi:predicted TIM-barrel fold metal-dependent hydrolase
MNLWDIPAIDQHAHPLLEADVWASTPFTSFFTESRDPDIIRHHARHTLFFRRSLRDIAALLSCEASETAIAARRREFGLDALTARCFQASHLAEVFLDDGFLPDAILPRQWHRRFVPVRRILRLEHLAENLLETNGPFDGFLDGFRRQIDPPPAGTVALKSIAAYRSGLAIAPVSLQEARACFNTLKESWTTGCRLSAKPLIDFLIMESMTIAARQRLPVQFHTGFGDPDLDLRNSNPLHLRWLLEAPGWREVPVVLLHAGYPFVREAGYLAAVYPQVYVDVGLTIPFVSIAGMQAVLRHLLELAPATKLLFSTDAHLTPELFYLGARWGRETLARVLEGAVHDGDLTASEADSTAERILHTNALRLYDVGSAGSPFPDPVP